MPPQEAFQLIVFGLCLEERNVGAGVIGDPEPVGESIGDDNIDGVVTPGQQQEADTTDTGQQRQPVQRIEAIRCV